jgi:hypothetical protein
LDSNLGFSSHNDGVVVDMRRRLDVIRRLSAHIPRSKFLSEIGGSLVVGNLRTAAWITREANVGPSIGSPSSGQDAAAQVVLSDLSRLLLWVSRADKFQRADLLDRE